MEMAAEQSALNVIGADDGSGAAETLPLPEGENDECMLGARACAHMMASL